MKLLLFLVLLAALILNECLAEETYCKSRFLHEIPLVRYRGTNLNRRDVENGLATIINAKQAISIFPDYDPNDLDIHYSLEMTDMRYATYSYREDAVPILWDEEDVVYLIFFTLSTNGTEFPPYRPINPVHENDFISDRAITFNAREKFLDFGRDLLNIPRERIEYRIEIDEKYDGIYKVYGIRKYVPGMSLVEDCKLIGMAYLHDEAARVTRFAVINQEIVDELDKERGLPKIPPIVPPVPIQEDVKNDDRFVDNLIQI